MTCHGALRTGEMCPRQAIDGEIFCNYHKAAAILNYDFSRAERFSRPATQKQKATIAKLRARYPEKALEVELAMNAPNKPGWYYLLAEATKGEAMWIIYTLTQLEQNEVTNGPQT